MKLSWLYCACVFLVISCSGHLSASVRYRAEEIISPPGFSFRMATHANNDGSFIGYMCADTNTACTNAPINRQSALSTITQQDTQLWSIVVWSKEHGFRFLKDMTEPWLCVTSVQASSINGNLVVTGIDKRDLWADTDSIPVRNYLLVPEWPSQ